MESIAVTSTPISDVGMRTTTPPPLRPAVRVREERDVLASLLRVAAWSPIVAGDGRYVGQAELQAAAAQVAEALGAARLSPDDLPSPAVQADALRVLRTRVLDQLRSPKWALTVSQITRLWSAFERVERRVSSEPAENDHMSPETLRQVTEVVHDLRSPLASVLLLSDALEVRGRARGDAQVQRHARLIQGAILAMHNLVSDLRDLARGSQSLIEPSPEEFSLDEVLGDITSAVAPIAEERHLAFEVVAPVNARCTGYPTALRRAVLNLVTNALKFTDEGYVKVVVAVADDGAMSIAVIDSGHGLPPHIAECVRNGGWLGSTGTPPVSGTFALGIGLALCQRLASMMGGSLLLPRTGPCGTTFELQLPAMLARTAR